MASESFANFGDAIAGPAFYKYFVCGANNLPVAEIICQREQIQITLLTRPSDGKLFVSEYSNKYCIETQIKNLLLAKRSENNKNFWLFLDSNFDLFLYDTNSSQILLRVKDFNVENDNEVKKEWLLNFNENNEGLKSGRLR